MRVNKVTIRNIMGIEELEVVPGAVTIAEGQNNSGKTSFLEAIKALAVGGHDATLLRNGADEGEVVLVLDDDTEIRKRIRAEASDLDITRADGGKRSAPQTYLNRMLIDTRAVNPVAFIDPPGAKTPEAKSKAQAKMVLEAWPVDIDPEEVAEALERTGIEPDAGGGLEALARTRQAVYDARTGVNRLAKEHEGTVGQLRKTIDPDLAADDQPHAKVEAFESQLNRIEQDAGIQRRTLDRVLSQDVEAIREGATVDIDALKEKIRERERKRDADIEMRKDEYREKVHAFQLETDAKRAGVKEKLGAAKEAGKGYDRQIEASRALEEQRGKLETRQKESAALTAAIERLDALKVSALERLPLKDIEVRGGMLYHGDVPFHRLNTERQWKTAIALALHQVGDVPIICADGLERLDHENYEAFLGEIRGRDVHLFASRVTDEGFHIRTEG